MIVSFGFDNSAVGRRIARQFQSDQRHYRAHGSRRQDDINPIHAHILDENGHCHENNAGDDESAQCVFVSHLIDNNQCRGDEGKTGSQVCRRLPLSNQNKQQSTDAVHEKRNGRADSQDVRNQNRCAEHGKGVLNT